MQKVVFCSPICHVLHYCLRQNISQSMPTLCMSRHYAAENYLQIIHPSLTTVNLANFTNNCFTPAFSNCTVAFMFSPEPSSRITLPIPKRSCSITQFSFRLPTVALPPSSPATMRRLCIEATARRRWKLGEKYHAQAVLRGERPPSA